MPELPEVEAVVRTLRPLVQGQRIRCVHVFHPIAVKPQEASRLADLATNRAIQRVDRKGKYVLLALDRGLLTMHFRLDGQLVWFLDRAELLERANLKENGVHVEDRKSTRLNSSHGYISYAVFCLKKKKNT